MASLCPQKKKKQYFILCSKALSALPLEYISQISYLSALPSFYYNSALIALFLSIK